MMGNTKRRARLDLKALLTGHLAQDDVDLKHSTPGGSTVERRLDPCACKAKVIDNLADPEAVTQGCIEFCTHEASNLSKNVSKYGKGGTDSRIPRLQRRRRGQAPLGAALHTKAQIRLIRQYSL